MSRETTIRVTLPVDRELIGLLNDIEATRRRAGKSEPGERAGIVRYESLCASLEAMAAAAFTREPDAAEYVPAARDAEFFTRAGDQVSVTLTLPMEPGIRAGSSTGAAAPPPAAAWPVRDDLKGRQLVEQRFREQLAAAVDVPGRDRSSTLSPSGIHNRVLTDVLREYVERGGHEPVSVPVVYRDGSTSQAPFPLRCLRLTQTSHCEPDLVLRLALLSVRYTEMDPVVDGAWLRNAEVSRPRAAAQTDDFVYETSARQLRVLTRNGELKVRLFIFQTGLETAVVGFFRAVVEHLLRHPGTLEVVPMFYSSRTKNPGGRPSAEEEFARFERGALWATDGGGRSRD
jgi:hypothetical protein